MSIQFLSEILKIKVVLIKEKAHFAGDELTCSKTSWVAVNWGLNLAWRRSGYQVNLRLKI